MSDCNCYSIMFPYMMLGGLVTGTSVLALCITCCYLKLKKMDDERFDTVTPSTKKRPRSDAYDDDGYDD